MSDTITITYDEYSRIIHRAIEATHKLEMCEAEKTRIIKEWQFDKEQGDRLIEYSTKRADTLSIKNYKLREAVEAVEWVGVPSIPTFNFVDICPWCHKNRPDHAPDCQRQIALGIEKEKL